MKWRNTLKASIAAAVAAAILGLAFAPYVYVELWPWTHPASRVGTDPVKLLHGGMFDDYFAVQDLRDGAFAIGEPRYYQGNYSYLIVGDRRALLLDAGSGTRDMRAVVAALTALPVTVIPSHLHFDHTGGLVGFERIALVDLPLLRSQVTDGRFTPTRWQFLGMFDDTRAPSFAVAEWLRPGAQIDLGGRTIVLLSTPGHTPESISLYDAAAQRLFTGDFIYPTTLYAFLPGASISRYRQTTQALLALLPPGATLWTAHCCRRHEDFSAPWLTVRDLRDLDRALARYDAGTLQGTGWFPRRYPVNDQMVIDVGLPWTTH